MNKNKGSIYDIRSVLVPDITNNKIFVWSYLCLEDLILSPLNTKKGISVANEDPYGFKLVNITRRGVLRQYYGKDVISYGCQDVCPRFTYGYNKCNSSVNTDPLNFVTKPFTYYLHMLSKTIHALLVERQEELNLEGLDLSTPFNHCTALLYYAGPTLKPLSYMPFHCDVTYNHKGKYVTSLNEQVENTPSVIISLGDDRQLHWQRQMLKTNNKTGRLKWYDVSMSDFSRTINLYDKSIYVVNTLDEKPIIDPMSSCFIRYQHGNVNVRKESMSCGLVLRVVNRIHSYNSFHQLLPEVDSVTEGNDTSTKVDVNEDKRIENSKNSTDTSVHESYHNEILRLFKNKFKSYRS